MSRAALPLALLWLNGCVPTLVWAGLSPDGRTSIRVVQDGALLRVTEGAGAERSYDAIAFDRLAWSPRGVVLPAQRDGAWWVLDGTDERGPFTEIGELVSAGDHVAYVTRAANGLRVIVDGRAGPAFDAIADGLLVDGEEGSVAYVVTRADGEHAVHDESIGPAVERVSLLTLGAKGHLVAYVDRGARDRLLVEHREVGIFDRVLELVVSRDEAHWAALVGAGEETALIHDGAERASAPFLTHLRISDDGAHAACLSPAPDGGSIDVVLDGARVAHHRRIDGEGLAFVPGDARVVLVWEDSQGMRVTLGSIESVRYESIEGPTLALRRAGWIGRRGEQSEVVIEGELVGTEEWAGTLSLAMHGDSYAYVARAAGQRFVVTPRGRWPIPRFFVDSLVLGDDGRHWAALVPDAAAHRLEVWIDGVPRVVLDDHELGGAIAIDTDRTLRDVVRAVVRGVLARADE